MSKHIVVVDGSPRPGRTTERLCDAFISGAESAGCTAVKLSLAKNRINGCIHCMQCGKNGYCAQKDAMEDIYPELERADLVVFATPIYFWHMTAQMKAFIDRLYALYVMKRFPKTSFKVIFVSGGKGPAMTEEADSFFRNVVEKRLGWPLKGVLHVDGTSSPEFDLEKDGWLKKAVDFGAEA